jgi:hypothetical protein
LEIESKTRAWSFTSGITLARRSEGKNMENIKKAVGDAGTFLSRAVQVIISCVKNGIVVVIENNANVNSIHWSNYK